MGRKGAWDAGRGRLGLGVRAQRRALMPNPDFGSGTGMTDGLHSSGRGADRPTWARVGQKEKQKEKGKERLTRRKQDGAQDQERKKERRIQIEVYGEF